MEQTIQLFKSTPSRISEDPQGQKNNKSRKTAHRGRANKNEGPRRNTTAHVGKSKQEARKRGTEGGREGGREGGVSPAFL